MSVIITTFWQPHQKDILKTTATSQEKILSLQPKKLKYCGPKEVDGVWIRLWFSCCFSQFYLLQLIFFKMAKTLNVLSFSILLPVPKSSGCTQTFQRGRTIKSFNSTTQTNHRTKRYLHKQELLKDVEAWFCRIKWKSCNVIPLTKHFQPRVFTASVVPKNHTLITICLFRDWMETILIPTTMVHIWAGFFSWFSSFTYHSTSVSWLENIKTYINKSGLMMVEWGVSTMDSWDSFYYCFCKLFKCLSFLLFSFE